jgi:uncharacterized protein (UPF0248 family)
MIPVQSLLARIQWDREFGRGEFTIGYYDRMEQRIMKVPYARIHLVPGNHFSFTAVLADGSAHDIPFHRVQEVHRDGELIWQRPALHAPARKPRSRAAHSK